MLGVATFTVAMLRSRVSPTDMGFAVLI
jgi:hypothetical protein